MPCSCAAVAISPPPAPPRPARRRRASTGQLRLLADPLDHVAAQPARAGLREGRDDDLVHPLVVDGVHGGRHGIGIADVAARVHARRLELRDRALHAPLRAGRIRGHDDGELGGRLLRPLAHRGQERLADHRLASDHEHVRALARLVEVDDDVLDRDVAGRLARAVDQVPAQPARALLRVRRDDHLVGLVLAQRVAQRLQRVGIDDGAAGGDARLVEQVERVAQASLGRGAPLVLVDDVAGARRVLRRDDGHADGPSAARRAPRRSGSCRPRSRSRARGCDVRRRSCDQLL